MGIAYLFLFVGYLLISVFLIWLVRRVFQKHRFRRRFTWLTVAFVILFPSYDIILQGALLGYYDLTRHPLQHITRTVDKPGSVYWEDNVWPGYDKNYRLWMIDHLLDGKHLDTLAMNGPDGKIYLYRYGQGDTPEIYANATALPPLNYHVALNPVPLWFWEKPFIWADRMEITDNRTKKVIAYSERYMGYSPRMIVIRALGKDYPFEGAWHVGDEDVYDFDNLVIFNKMREMEIYGHVGKIAPEIDRSNFSKFGVFTMTSNYLKNYRGKFNFKKGE